MCIDLLMLSSVFFILLVFLFIIVSWSPYSFILYYFISMLRKSLLFHFIYVLCVERIDIYLFIYLSPHPAIPREAVWTFSSPTKLKIVKNTYNRHRNVIYFTVVSKKSCTILCNKQSWAISTTANFTVLKGAVSRDFLAFFYFMNRSHLGPW